MNKEQFLAMSLPFGLKMYGINCSDEIDANNRVLSVYSIDTRFHQRDSTGCKIIGKPILHPLSDLTKEIEHKGEKFVPMIELVKTMFVKYPRSAFIENGRCFIGNTVQGNDKSNAHCFRFMYDKSHNSFSLCKLFCDGKSWRDDDEVFVANQLPMFLKLIEWHFDICGLIEKGEAIDVNSLSENPYK